ncbi:ATP-dependent zinc metalloprotease FtsH [Holdemania massiliensis]|uniref:ATP-dependent zinc metalloprotease FtsH n=1 Tax=Holdemania massiliensis TaxID=1468449 RepID=UPI001F05606C|nr:ATP-dependent zinc metalloprotease FtsH [Holdemania massiliensis]MCH1942669.1 ATP-dependent zinc metalloprotease FtsH [Holdemania massiliensis]
MKTEKPKNKKPLIYYYFVMMIALMAFNLFVTPMIQNQRIKEVGYSDLLAALDEKQVDEVEVDNQTGKIAYTIKDNKKNVFVTGIMPNDPALTDRLEQSGAQYTAVIPQQNSFLMDMLMWLVPIIIILGVGQLFSKQLAKKMGANTMTFGKSNAKIYVSAETGKTFKDVAGQDEAKEALSEIVDFLHNPDKYKKLGAKMPKGALLVGPPGTGKTLLAKAVAGEASVPFFSISGSEFVEMFVGMGAARVRDLFKQAQEKAPCIVFIDEIDTIGKKRDSANGMGGNDEREQTLNQLLAEMDGFDGSKGVVILAATNRPETLDKALLRPGRFDRRIPVELPDLKGREEILKVHVKEIVVSEDIDYRTIALSTSGASGAELANIVNEAALAAVRNGHTQVMQPDFDEAVDTVIAGKERKGAVISEKEKRIIAYHEIGHALVAAVSKNSAPVHKITIIPHTNGSLGYTMQVAEQESVLMSKDEILEKIRTLTGGRAAEEFMFNIVTSGASNDIEQATRLARAMVAQLGMSDQFGMTALETVNNRYLSGDASLICSNETAALVDKEVMAIIKNAHAEARKILEDNAQLLHEEAEYLLQKETITGEEFMEIFSRHQQLKALPQP